jgi:DNA invertase Pin-like site-specific DNA recombinase
MDIHRAGRRPKKSGADFYKTLLKQYETMTTRSLATYYHVSPGTISNWLKKARVSAPNQKQEVHAANE